MGQIKLRTKPPVEALDRYEFPWLVKDVDPAFGSDDFSIDSLKKQFEKAGGDLARHNRFKVIITPPEVLSDDYPIEFVTNMVKKVNMPQITVNNYPYERAGKILNIPTHVTFSDLSVSFYNDVNHVMRNLMIKWQKYCLSNWTENITSVPLLSLAGSVKVLQYNSDNMFTSLIEMTNCWPKSVSALEFDHHTDHSFNDFTVEFAYTEQLIAINPELDL